MLKVCKIKKASIITIGDEILNGGILDTNSRWLCRRLTELGVSVERISIVHDTVDAISIEISSALNSEVDYIIATGGLGPTPDDVTIESVAKLLRRDIKIDAEILGWVEKKMEFMSTLGFKGGMTKAREKFARIPDGMIPIYNKVGISPGLIEKLGDRTLIILPGVPREVESLFRDIEEYIESDVTIECEELKIFGLEADLADCFSNFTKNFPDVKLGSYPSRGTLLLKLYLSGKDAAQVKERLREAKKHLLKILPTA